MRLLLLGAIVAVVIIVIIKIVKLRRKKLDSHNAIYSKQEPYLETKKLTEVAQRAELTEIREDHAIKPENNQQRNLDREVGGLEEGKKGDEKENKKLMEQHIEDVWDDRSKKVDEMGSVNPIRGHDKESMIWRSKKHKLDEQKHEKHEKHEKHDNHEHKDNFGKNYDSRSDQSGGFRQMIKARQDRSNELGGKNDGAWR